MQRILTHCAKIYACAFLAEKCGTDAMAAFDRFFTDETGLADTEHALAVMSRSFLLASAGEETVRLGEFTEYFLTEFQKLTEKFFLAKNAAGTYYAAPVRLIPWPQHIADLRADDMEKALKQGAAAETAIRIAEKQERRSMFRVVDPADAAACEELRKSIAEEIEEEKEKKKGDGDAE